jgi:hypothetical protein
MLVTQFTDDDEEESPAEKSAPEYAFDGFNIEFSEKIALMPLSPNRGMVARAQSIPRPFILPVNKWSLRS